MAYREREDIPRSDSNLRHQLLCYEHTVCNAPMCPSVPQHNLIAWHIILLLHMNWLTSCISIKTFDCLFKVWFQATLHRASLVCSVRWCYDKYFKPETVLWCVCLEIVPECLCYYKERPWKCENSCATGGALLKTEC